MDKKKTTLFIDTNIFVIDLRYKNDINYKINRAFLDFVAAQDKGVTGIINLLELCGILSFNLNKQQISELFFYFSEKYNIEVLPSGDIDSSLPETPVKTIMDIISNKVSFGDALIAEFINRNVKPKAVFISWDAEHFKNILPIATLTPKEFMAPSILPSN